MIGKYGVSLGSRHLGQRGCSALSVVLMTVCVVSSCVCWWEVSVLECEVSVDLFGVWFESGTFLASWSLRVDLLTAQMLLTVSCVSLAVHLYSVSYMRADPHLNLFLAYLSMFTFFMLVLVTADNWVFMLVGWEGIGLC